MNSKQLLGIIIALICGNIADTLAENPLSMAGPVVFTCSLGVYVVVLYFINKMRKGK